jgi:hypothetical protein
MTNSAPADYDALRAMAQTLGMYLSRNHPFPGHDDDPGYTVMRNGYVVFAGDLDEIGDFLTSETRGRAPTDQAGEA